jgi:hypothetical protein
MMRERWDNSHFFYLVETDESQFNSMQCMMTERDGQRVYLVEKDEEQQRDERS